MLNEKAFFVRRFWLIRRAIALTMSMVLLGTITGLPAYAQTEGGSTPIKATAQSEIAYTGAGTSDKNANYTQYLESLSSRQQEGTEASFQAGDLTDTNGLHLVAKTLSTGEKSLHLDEKSGQVTMRLTVEKAGWYMVGLVYYASGTNGDEMAMSLNWDGVQPFQELTQISLPRCYMNEQNPFQMDLLGNQLRPTQVEAAQRQTHYLTNTEGYYSDPYCFFLEAGAHTLGLQFLTEGIDLVQILLTPTVKTATYDQVKAEYVKAGYAPSGERKLIEGESALYKSDKTLYPTSDSISPSTSPAKPGLTLLNTFGQTYWKYPGQAISWEVEVPANGLYQVAFRVKQNYNRGMISTRRFYVDGEVPYDTCETIAFPYKADWYIYVLETEDTPCEIYLTQGKHTLTMEAITGDMAPFLTETEDVLNRLNAIYLRILAITGTTPDAYRDYNLDKAIPGLIDDLTKMSDNLSDMASRLETVIGQEGSTASLLFEMASQMKSFVKSPSAIPLRLDAFKGNISALGSWLGTLNEQPLELDYIELYSADQQSPSANTGFWNSFTFGVKAFFASFTQDYSMAGVITKTDANITKEITVWVNSGRDQTQIIRRMVEDDFTPSTGISVKLNLVPGSDTLLQATLAGKGPDLALLVPSDLAVNLAKRGAAAELSQYTGFTDVYKRFHESAWVKYRYKDGVYAIPNTEEFYMLFYRSDILNQLGVKVPTTWQELYSLLPIIQRSNMEVGIPTDQLVYEMLLYQEGGTFFNKDLTTTTFDSQEALNAFRMWTSFFTQYSFPLTYDFYNRFRTGEMPIGIANYSMYNTLAVLAPEIRGLWDMTLVPGITQVDGTVNHTVTSSGLSSIMMERAKDKTSSFSFLEWWTGDESQLRFGEEIEGLLGASGRYCAANQNTVADLSWPDDTYTVLLKQWESVTAIPQLPSSYEVSRNVLNAFRSVVYSGNNAREMLNKYSQIIDIEIARKNAQ